MKPKNNKGLRPLVSILATYFLTLWVVTLLVSCTTGQTALPVPTVIYPNSSAVVQVTVLSREKFALSNHSALPIYYQVFPTELLPLIDWAPCETDESCREIQILPSQSLTFRFDDTAQRDTESISVFWWQRESDPGQHNPEYRNPQQISFPAP
ncbi:MAG: hypothetical protein IH859_07695 [Chloroflexi bacterium]|nr:hypothetical protein [Chloroflexota bacterium]